MCHIPLRGAVYIKWQDITAILRRARVIFELTGLIQLNELNRLNELNELMHRHPADFLSLGANESV